MSRGARLAAPVVTAAADFVRERTGLIFGSSRHSALEAGLTSTMRRAGLGDPEELLARLDTQSELLDDLIGEITVGETYFFRQSEQFDLIRDEILPAWRGRPGREGPFRCWSAGCATGEEPYSLAILVRQQGLAGQVRILGTDLSRAALIRAARARYSRWSFRGVPDEVVQTHFSAVGNGFELAPALCAAVEFRYLNLAFDAYPSLSTGVWGMDLVLCRNVLIYFDAATVERVAHRLIASLSDDGWLLLGASDPMLTGITPCEVVVTTAGLAYRRSSTSRRAAVPVPRLAVESPAALPMEFPIERPVEEPVRAPPPVGSDPAAWVARVRTLANRGDLAEAGRLCATALELHPEIAELQYLSALLLGEADRPADAVAAARRALYLDPQLIVAHMMLGTASARLGLTAAARRSFRNAERLLTALPPSTTVPASDGEPAGRLVEMARVQLRLLAELPQ